MTTSSPQRTTRLAAGGLAVLLYGGLAVAQTANVTPINIPTSGSVSVSALNNRGHVTGYTTDALGVQRAFFWDGAVLDLGTLGGSRSQAFDLNDVDQTTGYAWSLNDASFRAFLGIGQTLTDLGTLGGTDAAGSAINSAGQVTGYSYVVPGSLETRPFVTRGGLMVDLGSLGGTQGAGVDVNDSGQVTGYSTLLDDLIIHPFFHDGSVLHDVGSLGGTYSIANDLNNLGEVAGFSSLANEYDFHAFLYRGGAIGDLGTLGGTFSIAYAVNDHSTVVGDSTLVDDLTNQGFIWRAGVMTSLGHLGSQFSTAWSLNNSNQVVGVSTNALGLSRAFLWQNGSMLDLNSTLPAGSGWVLESAHYINDAGQIVGNGVFQGQPSWYRLEFRANQNHPPVALAGPDGTVECGMLAALDGSGSSDPDGDVLAFAWYEGNVLLGNAARINVELAPGAHTLRLQVTDAQGVTAEDEVVVTVRDTAVPAVACPQGKSASADAEGGAAVPDFLAGTVATDGCAAADQLVKSQQPAAGTRLGCGVHRIVVSVVDPAGNVGVCESTFAVVDTTPPQVTAPTVITRAVGENCSVAVPNLLHEIVASDNCTPGDNLVRTQSPAAGAVVGKGEHTVQVHVTDEAGNVTVKDITLRVLDQTAPQVFSISATPNVVRPANKQMIPIAISVAATDNCDSQPVSRILRVESSDLVIGAGDHTSVDWEITGDLTLKVRAEVSSESTRVYTVIVSTKDCSGNCRETPVEIVIQKNKNSDTLEAQAQLAAAKTAAAKKAVAKGKKK